MNLTGCYFNPERAGEGFNLFEHEGRVYGHFFTYDDIGDPTFYEVGCTRTGDTVSGVVRRYAGGSMGSPQNPRKVEGEEVGNVAFSDDFVDAYIDGTSIEYSLTRLFPPLPPEQPIATLRKKNHGSTQWQATSTPTTGTLMIYWDRLREGDNDVYEVEITPNRDLLVTSLGAHGYGDPRWVNVPNSLEAGVPVVVKLRIDKAGRPSGASNAHFQMDTNHGTLILVTAHIMQGG